MSLRALGLRKRYGATEALAGVDLELRSGAHLCVMGPSGSGKTTLLRALAGLEALDAGEIWLGDRRLDALAPERRPLRTVFQTPALFPHLDVLANVRFVDRLAGGGPNDPEVARELLARLGLDPAVFATRSVDALSGGERARVALARALYGAPPWLLLDEPLSALDRPRRSALRRTLARLGRERGVAMLHVTHAAADALAIADELVILDAGRILARGGPAELYRRPPDLQTARMLGELGPIPDPARAGYLRPESLKLVAAGAGRVDAQRVASSCIGPLWEHELAVAGVDAGPILATSARAWEGSERCGLTWDDDDELRLA